MRRCFTSCLTVVAIIVGATALAGAADRNVFKVKCSVDDSELLEIWAKAYARIDPRFELVVETGSGQPPLRDLFDGDMDLLVARERFRDYDEVLTEHPEATISKTLVAVKGETIIVHPGNPVGYLTFEQVRAVFIGETTNWKDLGGPDQPIQVVIKDGGRTLRVFQDVFLKDAAFAESALVVEDKEVVVREVSARPWAIGFSSLYFSLPALETIKIVRLGDAPGSGESSFALVYPAIFCVRDGAPEPLRDFLEWVVTPAAQEFVNGTRFAPLAVAGDLDLGW